MSNELDRIYVELLTDTLTSLRAFGAKIVEHETEFTITDLPYLSRLWMVDLIALDAVYCKQPAKLRLSKGRSRGVCPLERWSYCGGPDVFSSHLLDILWQDGVILPDGTVSIPRSDRHPLSTVELVETALRLYAKLHPVD